MRPVAFPADSVAETLERLRVASMDQLVVALGSPSTRTVLRKLKQLDTLSSYSHGGQYYTLRATARFDADGLWDHGGVRFSTRGTLRATIAELTEAAPRGWYARELDALVGVGSLVTLRRLVQDQDLACVKLDGRSLYCSADLERQRRQVAARHAGGPLMTLLAPLRPEHLAAAAHRFLRALDERQRRLYAGLTSLQCGEGGDHRAAALCGLHAKTVAKGRRELVLGNIPPGRVRRPGGGRKPLVKKTLP